MPKIVDHDARRREVARAVLRVVATSGVSGVTLGAVSAESGWSRGVLTHYFTDKDAMVEAALREGMRDLSKNLAAAAAEPDTRRALSLILDEVLPLDERRLAFARVYVSFAGEAMVAEHLRGYFSYNHAAWREMLADVIARGRDAGQVADDVDPASIAELLGALAEGLRMRAFFDDTLRGEALRAELGGWIDRLLPPPDLLN